MSTHSHKPISDDLLFRSLRFDLLGASRLLSAIAQPPSSHLSADMITEIARDEGVSAERTRKLIDSFVELRILERSSDVLIRVPSQSDARDASIFLRGAANAVFEFRDSNSVEIVLSPPLHPSRLMDVLPKQKFGWARLHNTRDALIALTSTAKSRLVILSPFLDDVVRVLTTPLRRSNWEKPVFRSSSGMTPNRRITQRHRNEPHGRINGFADR